MESTPMNFEFALLRRTREHLINFLDYYDMEALLAVPNGFKNNMYWNIAHALCTQQLLHYYLSDNALLVNNDFVNDYKKGSKPHFNEEDSDKEYLMELLKESANRLPKDYQSEKLAYYKPYETSYGIALNNIEEAIRFNNIHENLHLGYIMAIRKAII